MLGLATAYHFFPVIKRSISPPLPRAQIMAPLDLVRQTKALGRLPVVNFAAGGVATPADAAMMMQLGCDGVFVGSGIFKSSDPAARARAIVQAVTHFQGAPYPLPPPPPAPFAPRQSRFAAHPRHAPLTRPPTHLYPRLPTADPAIIAEVSEGLGEPMVGIECKGPNFVAYSTRHEGS